MDVLLRPGDSIRTYFWNVDWERRLHITMDRIEDALFDYPAAAFEWAQELPELFALRPARVTDVHQLRAEALEATARGLVGRLEEAEANLADVLTRAKASRAMPEDLVGWMHAKYASMLIRLDRNDEAARVIDEGHDRLVLKTPEVTTARAQLHICQALIHHSRGDWVKARAHYKIAYDMTEHRKKIQGGYYRRGDITKTSALVNFLHVTAHLEPDVKKRLAYISNELILPRHSIRADWGFAPYHEVVTAAMVGRLQMEAGETLQALPNVEYSARGFLKLRMPVEALDMVLDLAAIQPHHQTVSRVFRFVLQQKRLSPKLIELVRRGGLDHAAAIRQEIAAERKRRGQARVAA